MVEEMEYGFKKNSVFLVTGAAGFIGSNLTETILNLGYKVRAVDNFEEGKKENISSFFNNKNFELIEGDITNFEICKRACDGVDYVLHQAALSSVPASIETPVIYEEVNIGGMAKMLQAAKECGVKRFMYASSASVYGNSLTLPQVEGKEGDVISPYALTKKTDELYAKMYNDIYGLETIGMRYFNVFGKRQNPNSEYSAVISLFIKKILNSERPTIYGDGEQSRDFTYIDNAVQANLKACLAPKKACGQVYNIACGEKITLNQLLEKICSILKSDIKPIYSAERKGDIKHSLADINKAKELLGYVPMYNLDKGLNETINWILSSR